MTNKTYDYIILGAGAAGLSLAYRMCIDPFFKEKRIAVVDKQHKNKNDRTWSFWEVGDGLFDPVVAKKWNKLKFYSKTLEKQLDIHPYQYKMIRGIDFYTHTLEKVEATANIELIFSEVQEVKEDQNSAHIYLSNGLSLTAPILFKSYPSISNVGPEHHTYVDQHFKGYFVETENPAFDPEEAVFMDFRIEQNGESRFFYVLPETDKKALIEVAIFSNEHLTSASYDVILKDYIDRYQNLGHYKILEEEMGVIPMTTYPFDKHNTTHIFHIGTGGGIVKASSGYAFSRIQKHSDQVIECLKKGKPLKQSYNGLHGRFRFYDRIMLHSILENGVSGEEVFTSLFKQKKASKIFKFLDQRTSFVEDLDIFTAPPMMPFTKSLFQLIRK